MRDNPEKPSGFIIHRHGEMIDFNDYSVCIVFADFKDCL